MSLGSRCGAEGVLIRFSTVAKCLDVIQSQVVKVACCFCFVPWRGISGELLEILVSTHSDFLDYSVYLACKRASSSPSLLHMSYDFNLKGSSSICRPPGATPAHSCWPGYGLRSMDLLWNTMFLEEQTALHLECRRTRTRPPPPIPWILSYQLTYRTDNSETKACRCTWYI